MKSAAIISYAHWRDTHLAGVPLHLPEDDADHDGTTNLLEFVFGTSPALPSAPPHLPTSIVGAAGLEFLEVSIPRLADRLALLSVEVSENLADWDSGPAATQEISNTADRLVVRSQAPVGPAPSRGFLRLKVELPP